jgi:hypothetical protein
MEMLKLPFKILLLGLETNCKKLFYEAPFQLSQEEAGECTFNVYCAVGYFSLRKFPAVSHLSHSFARIVPYQIDQYNFAYGMPN